MSPNCDGLPGNELSYREGEDFQPLDVSGVVAVTGVTKGKGGLHASPPCGGVSETNSLIEKVKKSFNLQMSLLSWRQKVLLRENVASM